MKPYVQQKELRAKTLFCTLFFVTNENDVANWVLYLELLLIQISLIKLYSLHEMEYIYQLKITPIYMK